MSVFEAVMLVCFGVSWPISIIKAIRTKVVSGKSPLFMALICVGYISGLAHKVLYSRDLVMLLYALNLTAVAIDLCLYYVYQNKRTQSRSLDEATS